MHVPILLYHSVSEQATRAYAEYAVAPSVFSEHLAYLNESGYTAMTVSTFVSRYIGNGRAETGERPIVVTFDDGLRDFATGALPVLTRFSVPATLYLATGLVGRTARWLDPLGEGERPMLSWTEVAEVAQSGVEIGGHSHTHPELDILSAEALNREIRLCRGTLEERLGRPVATFSYPHGYSSDRVRRAVRTEGFTSACAVGGALSSNLDDPFRLARIPVGRETSVAALRRTLESESPAVHVWPERPATRAWRVARRARARVRTVQW